MWWRKIFGIWLPRWVFSKSDSALWGGKLASPAARFALIDSNLKRKISNYASAVKRKRSKLNFIYSACHVETEGFGMCQEVNMDDYFISYLLLSYQIIVPYS